MRYMGDATNPYNIPGLPGYDPTQPIGVQPSSTPTAPAAPGAPAVTPPCTPLPANTKAAMLAQVPFLCAAQQQDMYDLAAATAQASTAKMEFIGLGAFLGGVVGFFAARFLKNRK
jgi:hypothetical protein